MDVMPLIWDFGGYPIHLYPSNQKGRIWAFYGVGYFHIKNGNTNRGRCSPHFLDVDMWI